MAFTAARPVLEQPVNWPMQRAGLISRKLKAIDGSPDVKRVKHRMVGGTSRYYGLDMLELGKNTGEVGREVEYGECVI